MERMRQIWIAISGNKRRMYVAAVVITITAAILLFCRYGENNEVAWDGKKKEMDSSKTVTATSSQSTADSEDTTKNAGSESWYVDIEGEVKNPGVYTAGRKTRVFEIVEKAGGFTGNADPTLINQAEIVTDGEKITVPAKGATGEAEAGNTGSTVSGNDLNGAFSGFININTAGAETLQQIPGVGPATAQKILDYREQNGRFRKIEDLMQVSGIGEKTFDKMRNTITV